MQSAREARSHDVLRSSRSQRVVQGYVARNGLAQKHKPRLHIRRLHFAICNILDISQSPETSGRTSRNGMYKFRVDHVHLLSSQFAASWTLHQSSTHNSSNSLTSEPKTSIAYYLNTGIPPLLGEYSKALSRSTTLAFYASQKQEAVLPGLGVLAAQSRYQTGLVAGKTVSPSQTATAWLEQFCRILSSASSRNGPSAKAH
jgi:hypothetical protein